MDSKVKVTMIQVGLVTSKEVELRYYWYQCNPRDRYLEQHVAQNLKTGLRGEHPIESESVTVLFFASSLATADSEAQ